MTQHKRQIPNTKSNKTHKILASVIALIVGLSSHSLLAASQGTNIIGSDESPTVLNVVPWKSKELSVDPWKTREGPSSTILDQVLKPLDRDELRREVQYFNLLHQSEAPMFFLAE